MYRNYYQKDYCQCNNDKQDTYNGISDTCKYVENKTEKYYDECECGFDEEDRLFPENPVFGQSYVPWQIMDKTFAPEVGLKMGTIFPELVSPYYPGDDARVIAFLSASNKIGEGCNK